jgi:hypothetical protein
MIIYPLPPAELDDRTLEKQIKAIAQVLCNVHYYAHVETNVKDIPLEQNYGAYLAFTNWAGKCLANYNELVRMGVACIQECYFRWNEPIPENTSYKYAEVIEWAKQTKPALEEHGTKVVDVNGSPRFLAMPKNETTPFPLVMPDKYKRYPLGVDTFNKAIEESYRNYYRAKLQKPRKIKCKECDGFWTLVFNNEDYDKNCPRCEAKGYIKKQITPKWTRRETPEYLKQN